MPKLPDRRSDVPEWLSIKDYAIRYNIHRNTVSKWIESNLLIIYRCQRTIRIQNRPPDQHHRATS